MCNIAVCPAERLFCGERDTREEYVAVPDSRRTPYDTVGLSEETNGRGAREGERTQPGFPRKAGDQMVLNPAKEIPSREPQLPDGSREK